jgi:hypothetical protein
MTVRPPEPLRARKPRQSAFCHHTRHLVAGFSDILLTSAGSRLLFYRVFREVIEVILTLLHVISAYFAVDYSSR